MGTKLTDMHSVSEIVSEMTLEQKARLVIGGSPFSTEEMEEFGIPSMKMLDSCNGLNTLENLGDKVYMAIAEKAKEAGAPLDREKNAAMGGLLIALAELKKMEIERAKSGAAPSPQLLGCYPPGIALGCTWNPDVIEECGGALAKEMSSYGVDMILGPNVNIHRDPLCGRLGESFSEDPYLVGKSASAMIKGIQNEGVVACVKHFAANNQEKDRLGVYEHIPERALREIYLPGFKACVDAGVKTVMSAYNNINGAPSAMNPWLLTKVLREEWGFKGFVVSDWGAAYDQVKTIAAGNDLTMPGPRGIKCIIEAVENGLLEESKIDECVTNILNVIVESTAMTKKYHSNNMEEAKEVMAKTLRESMVLLKNDGVLPLAKGSKVALYGKRATKPTNCPEGSSKVNTDLSTNLYDSLMDLIGEDNVILEGENEETGIWIVVAGRNGHEGNDCPSLEIDDDDKAVLSSVIAKAKAANGKVVLVLNTTGPVNLEAYEETADAILCPFLTGMMGGKVIAEALVGEFNPSGKLPMTWPKHYYDCPSYKNFGGEKKEVWYGEGIYVGYRWYDARHIVPAYPFGYGLSYTTYDITDVRMNDEANVDKGDFPVNVTVKNTGNMAGSEVIQLYVSPKLPLFDRPVKELKGFKKVHLEAGEEKTVTIILNKESFAGYSVELEEWATVPGEYDILIGTSAADIADTKTVIINCKNPFGLSGKSSLLEVVQNEKAIELINNIIEDDFAVVSHVALEYAPDSEFKAIWFGTNTVGLLKKKGWDDKKINDTYEFIISKFEEC